MVPSNAVDTIMASTSCCSVDVLHNEFRCQVDLLSRQSAHRDPLQSARATERVRPSINPQAQRSGGNCVGSPPSLFQQSCHLHGTV